MARRLHEYGFESRYRTLSLCPTCLDLFDDPSLNPRHAELQQCRCHRGDEPRWPGYDCNERARLCDCCGRYVLRSGSRWSPFFCPPCKERVVALNQEAGFALIPLGRHSLMNGLGLTGQPDRAAIERFVRRVGDLGKRMDRLQEVWKPAHLRGELERLGLLGNGDAPPGGIPLRTYLTAVARDDAGSSADHRLLAFRGLADCFGARRREVGSCGGAQLLHS